MSKDDSLTVKQLDYLIRLQDSEKKQIMVRKFLYPKNKLTLDELTVSEASELIQLLLENS